MITNFIFYLIMALGWSNIIVDLYSDMNFLQFKPFNCKPCFGAWFAIAIVLIAYPFGSIELLVLPAATYFINKVLQNQLL